MQNADQWAAATIAQTLTALEVDAARGLDAAAVAARRSVHGNNEIAAAKPHPLRMFLRRFWGVSAWMLELIILLSLALRKYTDVAVVSALLVVNAVLGHVQERRAAGVVEALRQRLQVGARVLRDGAWCGVPARELVPGDVVRLRAGDIVPADVKLLDGTLRLDQSVLTGESQEVHREAGGMLWSGALVRRGEATGVVVLIGAATYFGRTTQLVQEARPKLHVEAVVSGVVRRLFLIVGVLLGLVVLLAALRGSASLEIVPLLLVLLMSAVPVALPVMFTVSMAVGARELAKRGILVTRLSAAEDAATMDVLCIDKTGTLTQNRLTVTAVVPCGSARESEILHAGALASHEADRDPIDAAFLRAFAADPAHGSALPAVRLSFSPFDPELRRTEARVLCDGRRLRIAKGAIETIAGLCGLDAPAKAALAPRIAALAASGARLLAVAQGPEDGPLAFLGLVALADPPRPDAGDLIGRLRALGIAVKMLTGDALSVARAVAARVGLPDIRHLGDVKAAAGHAGGESDRLLGACDGYAEVYPEDKYRVVRSLQARGHVVGMTGDGVNDAPALRQAEVGIAVSTATDVAKSAASVVLTAPGLADIVALVEQGRIVYQRVLTWIVNKISRTILKASFVAVAFVATGRFVISAFAMLLLVFMTDFAKIALATDRARPSPRPERWDPGGPVALAVALGLMMVAEALALLWFCYRRCGLDRDAGALHAFSFLTLLYFAVFSILSVRERRWFGASRPGRALAAALAADLLLGTACVLGGLPDLGHLSWRPSLAVFVYAAVACLAINDPLKVAMLRAGRGG